MRRDFLDKVALIMGTSFFEIGYFHQLGNYLSRHALASRRIFNLLMKVKLEFIPFLGLTILHRREKTYLGKPGRFVS